jgi:hypothetical protein
MSVGDAANGFPRNAGRTPGFKVSLAMQFPACIRAGRIDSESVVDALLGPALAVILHQLVNRIAGSALNPREPADQLWAGWAGQVFLLVHRCAALRKRTAGTTASVWVDHSD